MIEASQGKPIARDTRQGTAHRALVSATRRALVLCLCPLLASLPQVQAEEQVFRLRSVEAQRLIGDQVTWNLRGLHIPATSVLEKFVGRDLQGRRQIINRYGEAIGPVYLKSANDPGPVLWLQEHLVEQGLALTRPFVDSGFDSNGTALKLLQRENQARNKKRGLWAKSKQSTGRLFFTSDELGAEPFKYRGRFLLVEGRIRQAALRRSEGQPILYLNFGQEYRTDFTVRIQGPVLATLRKQLKAADKKPEDLPGLSVRVRGILALANGPSLDLDHTLALEWLNE